MPDLLYLKGREGHSKEAWTPADEEVGEVGRQAEKETRQQKEVIQC